MDKYYVYRPMLDLIGVSEGTSAKRGYNETLAYGLLTNGDVDLVSMTLDQIDALQTQMLKNPKNKWNSSALGMYQIVQKTRRMIQSTLSIPGSVLFNTDTQDQMACFLLGQRGIDKWLSGRLKIETLIHNLSQEWASLPDTNGASHYGGTARVSIAAVKNALNKVRLRHEEGQPKVTVNQPVVPKELDKEVRQKTNWLATIFGGGGVIAGVSTLLSGVDWQTAAVVLGGAAIACVAALVAGEWIVRRVRAIRAAVEA